MRQLPSGLPILSTIAACSLIICVTAGCNRSDTGKGYLAVPQNNIVRIIPGTSNAITPDRLHWTWSVLGERNWTKASATGLSLALTDAYPLNDVQRTHGTNTWNCDLIAERRPADPTVAHWTLVLHGSNGVTAQSAGAAELKGEPLDSVFAPVQTGDRTESLPASVTLARVNNDDVKVDLSK